MNTSTVEQMVWGLISAVVGIVIAIALGEYLIRKVGNGYSDKPLPTGNSAVDRERAKLEKRIVRDAGYEPPDDSKL